MLVNLYPNISVYSKANYQTKRANSVYNLNYGNSVSFSGNYNCIFKEIINYEIKNSDEVLKYFQKLFDIISDDADIVKTPYFDMISSKFRQKGGKDLLHTLQANLKTGKFEQLYKKLYANSDNCENGIVLAYKKDKPILLFDDLNRIYSDNSDKHQPFFTFRSFGEDQFEILKNKKDVLSCTQTSRDVCIETLFHKLSGNRKKVIINTPYSQDVTYYNKEGHKSFFKNLFLGGSIVIPR